MSARSALAAETALRARPAARSEARLWRIAFGIGVLSGVAQLAILRELAACQVLSTLGLSIRLTLAVVLAATGAGAALAPLLRGRDERRCFAALGLGLGLYLLALLLGFLRGLEPGLAARDVDAGTLLVLGLLVSPPFVACGLVLAHVTAALQSRAPQRLGAFVALSLLGTLLGVLVSHHFAQWLGVSSLLLLAAVLALPVATDRPVLAALLLLACCALPLEPALESLRRSRPAFDAPLTAENTTLVYSGWSPYQKVDLYTFEGEVLLGFYNGFWQWWSAARLDHPGAFPGYELLYDPAWIRDRDVLVIGSGAGMGLLHLERSQPHSLTGLELDPLVVSLARDRFAAFNAHVYERVPVLAMEGRAFLDASPRRFDVIVYEGSFLTAAHPNVPVSAENHLYTREGIAAALARLRPDGIGLVLFAGPERALARVAAAIEAQGAALAALRLSYANTLWWDLPVLVFGRDAARVGAVAAGVVSRAGDGRHARRVASPSRDSEALTDARPFLYAGAPGELRPLLGAFAATVLLALLGLGAPGRRRLRTYYLLLGGAFMLLQTALISSLRSFFGDPVSTAYAVLLLLLAGMAVGSARATALAAGSRTRRLTLGLAAGGAAACTLVYLPFGLGLAAQGLRFGVAALGLFPGAVLLGVLFPLGLRGQPEAAVPEAFAFDALGSVLGFLLFPLLALPFGVPSTLGAGALGYALVWLALPRA